MGKINHKKLLKEAMVQQVLGFFVIYFVIQFLQGSVSPLILTLVIVGVSVLRNYIVSVVLKNYRGLLKR